MQPGGCMKKAKHVFMQPGGCMKMYFTWKSGSETVLVFGPESVSYERSRRMQHAKMREISARVFFVKISKSQDSMIYTIFSFFRIHIPKMDSFPMLFSHPTRPPAGPYCPYNILGQFWIILTGCPYKIILLWVILTGFPVFPGSKLNQNDWFSSISRFKTESKWLVFQYF